MIVLHDEGRRPDCATVRRFMDDKAVRCRAVPVPRRDER